MSTAIISLAIIVAPFQAAFGYHPSDPGMNSQIDEIARPKVSDHEVSLAAASFKYWRDLKARDRLGRGQSLKSTKGNWAILVRRVKALDDPQKIAWVNTRINEVTYVPDNANWGVPDYWATPEEFMAKGGDCEDYAIAKHDLLRDSGFPASRMKIAVTNNHAVLLIDTGNKWIVLDNQKRKPYIFKSSLSKKINYTINDLEWTLRI